MIYDLSNLQDILLSFENILRIEYSENDISRIMRSAKHKLENAYQVKLDKTVYEIQAQNQLVSDNIQVFIEQLFEAVKSMTAFTHIVMFTKVNKLSLADVNYLGFTAETLRAALKYLQDKQLYEKRHSVIPAIRNAVNNIEMSQLKRLFVIMLVLEDLGLKEGVSAVAQYLYICGLEL
ncbi:MAG: hypothetical protein LBS29_04455 [Endomicrobium sp.]|jgi:hypothetical protein|nr:hypothetical protein [Endomicrobium sp.]